MIWKDLRNFFHEGFVETGTIMVLLAQHIQNMLLLLSRFSRILLYVTP